MFERVNTSPCYEFLSTCYDENHKPKNLHPEMRLPGWRERGTRLSRSEHVSAVITKNMVDRLTCAWCITKCNLTMHIASPKQKQFN